MKTLKGYDETEVIELMLKPLPKNAIKPHQTKSYLSQISPAYTRERLTKVFGLHGVGWGLDWDPMLADRFETSTNAGKVRYHFALLKADFWFKMIVDSSEIETIHIPVTGHSDNDNLGDAMAGARTSAISAGAKELLFQLHIYKNEEPPKPSASKKSLEVAKGPPPWRPTKGEFFVKATKEFPSLSLEDISDELKEAGFLEYNVDKAVEMMTALRERIKTEKSK
jgi:hypothetical protein